MPHPPADPDASVPHQPLADSAEAARLLRGGYVLAVSLIALLTIAGHLLVLDALRRGDRDATVINVAGRQRALSQKIALDLAEADRHLGTALGDDAFDRLAASLDTFRRSHDGLRNGADSPSLPPATDPTVLRLFAGIEPDFRQLVASADSALGRHRSGQADPATLRRDRDHAVQAAAAFLPRMHAIVDRKAVLAAARLADGVRVVAVLGIVTLLVLAGEAVLIFRPLIRRVRLVIEHGREATRTAVDVAKLNVRDRREIARGHDLVRRLSDENRQLRADLEHARRIAQVARDAA